MNNQSKNKYLFFILSSMIFVFAFSFISAEIVSLNSQTVFPGDTIQLTIKPTSSGFYNVIDVFDSSDNLVDVITVNCATICTKKNNRVGYTIPSNFLGDYYFATFDYDLDDYELDLFEVIEQGGAEGGTLTLNEIRNFNSGINLIVNPEQGKNANLFIDSSLNIKKCDTFGVNAYLCNSTLNSSCSNVFFNHEIPLSFISKAGNSCTFQYAGEDYFPFYQEPGDWRVVVKSGIAEDFADFVFTSLQAINYTSIIDFGALNAQVWNVGIPSEGIDLINFGNVNTRVDWSSDGFDCISENCTDFWNLNVGGEDLFQIDDDNLFAEENETGLNTSVINNISINYFPQGNLTVCLTNNCNSSIGEKIKTFFNLKIPDIQRGVYQGNIRITLS